MSKDPFIYKFKTPRSNYIYDINTNMLVSINKEIYDILGKKDISDSIDNSSEEFEIINEMKKSGLLSPNNIEIIEHPESYFLESTFKRRLNTITLQITQQCNLRCKYCVYSGDYDTRTHSNKMMTIEVAKRSIDFLINNSIDSNMLNIGFYGGEPLLRYDFIKECIEYAENKAEGKEISFQITTNATLITPEIVSYFERHNVFLTISLDGNKEAHDKNRVFATSGCGSFDVIIKNLGEIKKSFPKYFSKILFNTVIDPKNDFSCTNNFFTNYETIKDSTISTNLINYNYSKIHVDKNEDFIINWEYELFKLFLYKLGELSKKHITKLQDAYFASIKMTLFDRGVTNLRQRKAHPGGPCIPGIQRLFVNTDGVFYPCERVSEKSEIMKIGNIEDGFDIEKIYKLLNIGKITQDQCKNCYAFYFCGLCAAFADNLTELSKDIKLNNCESTRKRVENMLKDYCMLREFGYDFEKENL
ncbi:uncharacterized protein B0P06_000273 [Clostridium saccharoperbutylacetonicum]|uniref:Cys-rich peptide radical SAM maturase CcpM n=1 Tax=Clostridium saccharoperbutylacetonicum N1-4(HMT) TaxID=931276 RepID=M1MVT0_9CLOT|nr:MULTISPECIES: Cys-rich peptide radical SAM maturase CcpM [Clostridium]AGF55622.1 Cys-rich peptide radical SAM maturase CcpM [Clostridium saccharoperbutylacetonicum N1-4(HMT)]NRT63655.1 uncharacterized protein [Clostridium saccharoperbutylacetonicum]NSB27018.1 uncharacterized protein [Clostridium saccharoperbutylacetonicum]NSB40502.1 uncharacterized protein [Clostridium saccharoperbutylacetonicum]